MKIYKEDYKHYRNCPKLAWFLNAKNFEHAKRLLLNKEIVSFIELTNTQTSSKFNKELISVQDLSYYDDELSSFDLQIDIDEQGEYLGEQLIDGLETGFYAKEYFKKNNNWIDLEISENSQQIPLNDLPYEVLFEPRFEYENCVMKADILKRNGDGWDLIEVKAVTQVKEEHLWDLLYQYDILKKLNIKIKNIMIMHLNSNYFHQDTLILEDIFIFSKTWSKSKDSKKVSNIYDAIRDYLETHDLFFQYQDINRILNLPKEDVLSFLTNKYCHPNHNKLCSHIYRYFDINNTIFQLYRLRKTKKAQFFYDEGLFSLLDDKLLPFLTSYEHLRQYEVAKNPQKVIDVQKINELLEILKTYRYPIYMYDFETMKSAIPKFANSKVYQQIPFQYSVHVLLTSDFDLSRKTGINHYEYLSDGQNDPRKEVAYRLSRDLFSHGIGVYVAYNASFEKKVLSELWVLFPEIEKELKIIYNKTIDLMDFFKKLKIYKNEFSGSLSIKNTLPAFDAQFSYQDLNIKKGDMASEAFRRRVENNITIKNWHANFEIDMLKYCARDTWGMVILFDQIIKLLTPYLIKKIC